MKLIENNIDIVIIQDLCPTFHIQLQTDWLYELIKLECVSNADTSYELKSLSIMWKVFPIPCRRNLQEDQLTMFPQK